MNLQIILMFLISLLLTVVSGWSLGTFMRLNRVVKNYDTDRSLQAACQVSRSYITTGLTMGTVISILSLVILALSSWNLYKYF